MGGAIRLVRFSRYRSSSTSLCRKTCFSAGGGILSSPVGKHVVTLPIFRVHQNVWYRKLLETETSRKNSEDFEEASKHSWWKKNEAGGGPEPRSIIVDEAVTE